MLLLSGHVNNVLHRHVFHRHVSCEAVSQRENHISHINARECALMVNTTAKAKVLHSRTEPLATFAHWRRAVIR